MTETLNQWHGWWSWQVSSSRSEAVLISNIVKLDKFTSWQIVAISTALNENIGGAVFVRHKRSLLGSSDSIASQVVVSVLTVIVTKTVLLKQWNLFGWSWQGNASEAKEQTNRDFHFLKLAFVLLKKAILCFLSDWTADGRSLSVYIWKKFIPLSYASAAELD